MAAITVGGTVVHTVTQAAPCNEMPVRVGSLILNEGENYVWSAVIAPARGYAYLWMLPGCVAKVLWGQGGLSRSA